jgi:hypothetical protein
MVDISNNFGVFTIRIYISTLLFHIEAKRK